MQTDSEPMPECPKQLQPANRDIVDTLRTAGVAPQRMLELDQGRALAQWQNRQGEVRYERPRHHALSIYIDKGEQARRVLNGKVVSQGFPGAVCLFPAGSRSSWQISGQFEFFHLYFNDLDVARCAEQTWNADPDKRQLSELYHAEDPVLAQAGKLLALSDWQAPGQTMAMDHLAQWLLLQVVSRHSGVRQTLPEVTGQLSLCRRVYADRTGSRRCHSWSSGRLCTATIFGPLNRCPPGGIGFTGRHDEKHNRNSEKQSLCTGAVPSSQQSRRNTDQLCNRN